MKQSHSSSACKHGGRTCPRIAAAAVIAVFGVAGFGVALIVRLDCTGARFHSPLGHLNTAPGILADLPRPDDCVPSDEEQSDSASYIGGEGLPSGVETTGGYIVEMVNFMEDELPRQSKKVLVQEEMIYRVPQITSSLDKDAYAPQFVSFGPYHRGTEALRSADKYKWFFLEQILNMNKDVPLRKYLEEMDGVKQKVKGCYEEDTLIQTNDGSIMLLLDGCCILGFLGILPLPPQEVGAQTQKQDNLVAEASTVRKFISRVKKMLAPHPKQVALAVDAESKRTADSARIPLWHHDSIRHDLLLMENQLPFFVLEKIYGLATAGTPDELKDKVDQTIQKLLASYPLITTDQSFHHLLQCCHLKFRPAKANSSSSNSKPKDELQPWRGATDLYKAGIKFKPKLRNHSESLLDVELVSGRTLMIPTLIIEDSTSSVFRNLIAFEQSSTHENYFAAYAFFMGELMSTPGDVTLLVKEGVVKNYIGADKEVSDFFNNLVKRVVFDVNEEHFLSSTFEELKSSYNSVGNKYIADLKQNYCRSPWLVISVVAGAIVLVCTVVQTVFAVKG
ncbi:UPF0481 protein At3g47200-like [Curcuma longa]|uniref:UPF0481 protein At3g47200-like n=1 Tax=Curcuma longa TaxID=136217 RepID=UPI003D9F8894